MKNKYKRTLRRNISGQTVTPLWPPTTGTATSLARDSFPRISATNVDARTTSSVVTPKILFCDNQNAQYLPYSAIGCVPFGIIHTVLLEHFSYDGDR
jgi:hypothetical protein